MTKSKEILYKLCSKNLIEDLGWWGCLAPRVNATPFGYDHFDLRVSVDHVIYRNDQHIGSRPRADLKTWPLDS